MPNISDKLLSGVLQVKEALLMFLHIRDVHYFENKKRKLQSIVLSTF